MAAEHAEEYTDDGANDRMVCMYVTGDYTPSEDNQLRLQAGEMVEVLEKVNNTWWWVECEGVAGYAPANHLSTCRPDPEEDCWENEEYFTSYGHMRLHQEMLSDRPRTLAYKMAIERGASFMKNKVVLDVGCGTGILSLFCARHGQARKVYAVEMSDMADQARAIVHQNGYEEVIEVIHSKMEEVKLPEHVDLIISEWMGTFLLFEMMVESVVLARDQYLKQDGVVWPSCAELFLVPCSAENQFTKCVSMWSDVYGFDFTSLAEMASNELHGRPVHDHVMSLDDLLAEERTILKLDMNTVTVADLEVNEATFDYQIIKQGTMHGFASWFTATFAMPSSSSADVVLSTSPLSPLAMQLTHWKQDLFLLDQSLEVKEGDRVRGTVRVCRHKLWRRHLRVNLSYTHWRQEQTLSQEYRKTFALWR